MEEPPGDKLRRIIKGKKLETPIKPPATAEPDEIKPETPSTEEPFVTEELARAILEQTARDNEAAKKRAEAQKVPIVTTVQSDTAKIKSIKDAHALKRSGGYTRRPLPK